MIRLIFEILTTEYHFRPNMATSVIRTDINFQHDINSLERKLKKNTLQTLYWINNEHFIVLEFDFNFQYK